MEFRDIAETMAIALAVKLCDGTPADAVAKYFELLPEVKAQYAEQKKAQPANSLKSIKL